MSNKHTRFTSYFWHSFRMLLLTLIFGCIFAFSPWFEDGAPLRNIVFFAGLCGFTLGSGVTTFLFRLPLKA